MPRKPAANRFNTLIETATRIFIQKGYRRTQMADITGAMGLSSGAIYRYVESKEALFDLIVRAAASPELLTKEIELPIPTPQPGSTLSYVRQVVLRKGRFPVLERALGQKKVGDARVELESIVRELYRVMARDRQGIMLVERSALDWPELAVIWFGEMRSYLIDQLSCYLQSRMERRLLRAVPNAKASSRLIVETCAFFAIHRHEDPFPTPMDEALAEETAVDALVNAYKRR
jgi:AcrR family transcriptional regulator